MLRFGWRLGALKISPSMCLIDFHSGHLSKGPEERMGIVITTLGGAGNHKGRGIPCGREEGGPWHRCTISPLVFPSILAPLYKYHTIQYQVGSPCGVLRNVEVPRSRAS